MRFMVDAAGHNLIYCAKCLLNHSDKPKQAVTIGQGFALCEDHYTLMNGV